MGSSAVAVAKRVFLWLVVGADDESVALMVHRILVSVPARRDQQRAGARIRRGYETQLGSDVIPGRDDDIFP